MITINHTKSHIALKALVVDDEEIIHELDRISMRFVRLISTLVFKRKILYDLIRKLTPALDPKDKVKVETNIERGYVLPHPAAIVFIVEDVGSMDHRGSIETAHDPQQ